MNIVIVLAGGNGSRMKSNDVPKQFLLVADKPIIIYTLDKFEKSNNIDAIVIACKEGYKNQLEEYIDNYGIKKVVSIVNGGATRQESLYNGVLEAYALSSNPSDDIVLIHDAVRPAVSQELISKVISNAKKYGSCISVGRPIETIMIVDENGFVKDVKKREDCRTGKAPHAYTIELIYDIFQKSISDGKVDYIDDESMMHDYGVPLYTVNCSDANIKITNQLDYAAFKSYLFDKEDF